ncbi:hypothetical protein I4U23_003406 [Adineta vaga]|nr:hypothetical protein I4U23_003406 [Adineta vaga]
MTHLDSRLLANYSPLTDEHLRSYFSHERIQTHLRQAGLIGRRGELIPEKEYRTKLVRRERKKHVRQVLAENIVHRAIDMERARQAEIKRKLDMIEKKTLVHSVKESRRHTTGTEHSPTDLSKSDEIGSHSMHESWLQTRPKTTHQHRDVQLMNEEFDGQPRVLRVRSANVSDDFRRKHPSKGSSFHQRQLHRPKSSAAQRSSSLQFRSLTKTSDSSCRITMIYYGSHTKLEYDRSLFESTDEIMVMQQHCGGENLIVYKGNHKRGDEFSFNSHRHSDYPLGLSLYVKGLIDSRISTCCEYKHRNGVRLGGERGHFAVVSVQGSKPCLKCRFEEQMRSKDLNETNDEENKMITISMPVSDATGRKKTPVKIPVKHTSESENYSDDFDETGKVDTSKDGHSSNTNANKARSASSQGRFSKETKSPSTKTWHVTFHSSNIPTGSFQLPKNSSTDAFLQLSLVSTDGKTETEQYEIDMRDYPKCFKSGREDTFQIQLRNIGKPKQVRLLLQIADVDTDEIKWHLDHIELFDVDSRLHYKYSCNQWIRPSHEKLLNLTESFEGKTARKSHIQKPIIPIKRKPKVSSRSSSSDDEHNSVCYRVIIYPSKETDGEFDALNDSQMFIRLNNQPKVSFIYEKGTQSCPSFDSGKNQTFEINSMQNTNEQPMKLTIGYYNSNITARKWKLQKIVLINTKTNEETTFLCKEPLLRNDFNLRAEQTFLIQSKDDDDDDDNQKHSPRRTNVIEQASSRSESEERTPTKANRPIRSSPPESPKLKTTKKNKNEKKSSFTRSSQSTEDDEENEYDRTFNNQGSTDKHEVMDSSLSRPKTRRGLQDSFGTNGEHRDTSTKLQPESDIWRPPSQLGGRKQVAHSSDSDDLQEETTQSSDQHTHKILPATNANNKNEI